MWFKMVFDTWEEAVAFQREKLEYCIAKGWPIRDCSISDEVDYDTRKARYMAFVRPLVPAEGPW